MTENLIPSLIDPEITIQYALSYKEFVAGYKLAARKNLMLFFIYLVGMYLSSIAAAFLLVLVVFSSFDGAQASIRPLLPLLVLTVLLPLFLVASRRASFNRLKASSSNPEMVFQANQKVFSRQIQGMGELTWLWSKTAGFAQGKKMVVISVRKGAFIYIPRRVISDIQLLALKQMFEQSRSL